MNILCRVGWHKWERSIHLNAGLWETGRKCLRCPKYQWDRETFVRRHMSLYGDVPMTERQEKSMKRCGYEHIL